MPISIADLQIVIPLASAGTVLGALLGAWFKVKKLIDESTQEKINSAAEAVTKAVELVDLELKNEIEKLNLHIDAVHKDIQVLEKKAERDIEHVRITYNNEVRSLTEKIEGLKEEVRQQHGQLVALVSKLIGN